MILEYKNCKILIILTKELNALTKHPTNTHRMQSVKHKHGTFM